jgi:butyrate kinase
MKILVINPGSTSTKISIFEDKKEVYKEKLDHQKEEIAKFPRIPDQFEFRKQIVLNALKKAGFSLNDFDAIGGRGGNTHPLPNFLIYQTSLNSENRLF